MGCDTTDIATLAIFLDLSLSWSTLNWHLREVEKVLGPVEEMIKKESEKYALAVEVALHLQNNDLEKHECTIEGHEHAPLPMIKGSYGMW